MAGLGGPDPAAALRGEGRAPGDSRRARRGARVERGRREGESRALRAGYRPPPFTKSIDAWKSSTSFSYSVASARLTWIHSLELGNPAGWKAPTFSRENCNSRAADAGEHAVAHEVGVEAVDLLAGDSRKLQQDGVDLRLARGFGLGFFHEP